MKIKREQEVVQLQATLPFHTFDLYGGRGSADFGHPSARCWSLSRSSPCKGEHKQSNSVADVC